MDAEASLSFLGRFRAEDIAVPWIQPFVQTLAMICAEEPEMAPEGKTMVNFRRNLRQSKAVHVYLQFQKQIEPEAVDEGRRLAELVWGWPELSLANLQKLADQLSSQTPRWKGSRSPRSGSGGTASASTSGSSSEPPTLGRRKSNNSPSLPSSNAGE
jgi:hypothetical protein